MHHTLPAVTAALLTACAATSYSANYANAG